MKNVVLNADKAILRKHFKGIVPRDVEVAASTFQTVIDSYQVRFQTRVMGKTKSRKTKTSFELLKNNSKCNVAITPSIDPSPSPSASFLQQTLAPQPASQSPMYYPSMFPYFWYGGPVATETPVTLPPTSPPPLPPPPPPEEPDTQQ